MHANRNANVSENTPWISLCMWRILCTHSTWTSSVCKLQMHALKSVLKEKWTSLCLLKMNVAWNFCLKAPTFSTWIAALPVMCYKSIKTKKRNVNIQHCWMYICCCFFPTQWRNASQYLACWTPYAVILNLVQQKYRKAKSNITKCRKLLTFGHGCEWPWD